MADTQQVGARDRPGPPATAPPACKRRLVHSPLPHAPLHTTAEATPPPQTEKAFQKQLGVSGCFRSKDKKAPGKSGHRFFKNVGLNFKTPKEAIEGGRAVVVVVVLGCSGAASGRPGGACGLAQPLMPLLLPHRRHLRGQEVPIHRQRVHPRPHPHR